ncbi:MAG: adenosine deaminase [Acidobacteria bacterium]|nr:adenosine deaminase [Acidobacteriota bacterium]
MISNEPLADESVCRLPKVELHVHLEGSVQPETMRELSRMRGRVGRDVDKWIRQQQQRGYHYASFMEFVEAFKFVAVLLERPQDYGVAAARLMEWLAAQNVKYAEVTLSAGVVLWKRQPLDAVYEAVREASLEAEARLGLRVNWIFDAVRQFGAEHARQVVRWAGRYNSQGVVAFGLGGDEERGPAELFRDVYREARDLGLHCVAHAGETAGPESVRQAVELLGAERIGHGLAAARSPKLSALLRDRQIPLEACPTSNVAMGLVPRFEDYPLHVFLEAGVLLTLNSDDPALFGSSIEREFLQAARSFGLSWQQVVQLCENAVRAAFLPAEEKQSLLAGIREAAAI